MGLIDSPVQQSARRYYILRGWPDIWREYALARWLKTGVNEWYF